MNDVKTLAESYIYSEKSIYPLFLVVGDSDYVNVKEQLSALADIVGVSKYCASPDRFPNMDKFYDDLQDGKNKVVVGLGEYVALCGEQETFDTLSRLKDFPLKGGKVILLLRCVTDTVRKLQNNDPVRFNETQNRVAYIGSCSSELVFTCVSDKISLSNIDNGLKSVLEKFESGDSEKVTAKTKIQFKNSMIDVRNITTAYHGIRYLVPTFSVASEFGNDEQWSELLTALIEKNGNISTVFEKYGLPVSFPDEFEKFVQGSSFIDWLYFIALKLKAEELENSYLRYVLESDVKFENLKETVLNAIISIKHTDKRFEKFYKERANLIDKFSPHDITAFVNDNKINPEEALYKLTDKTLTEREEFIVLFSSLKKETVFKRLLFAYPDLYSYLQPYTFNDSKIDGDFRDLLTDYFNKYRWQKVQNIIEDDFIIQVEALANERKYNLLPSRNDILGGIDKKETFLYWVDALGVEFLGFIQTVCNRLNLKLKIHIGRADLPTITIKNRDFYENWQVPSNRVKDKRLDDVKHKEEGGYDYEKKKLPVHLARELDIISDILSEMAIKLNKHEYKKYLIVSDHGASRLAVIKEQDEKYETDTKGLHSGRCCIKSADCDYDLPFAAEEDGYLVLANYGRFKNSRKANVEVHGGASLEEVVVPVIEVMLANPNLKVQLLDDTVFVDYKTPAKLEIFSNTPLGNVKIIIDGKEYDSVKTDDTHYTVNTDIKKAREYSVDVYGEGSFVCKLKFTAEGRNKSNSDFDY